VTVETHVFERLSASDLFVLMWDDYGWSSDIGGLAIHDGTSLLDPDGRVRIEAVRARIEPRLHMVPRFRQLAEERQQIDLPTELLDRYVGLYQLDLHGTVTVTRTDGGLVAEATGPGVAPIYPATETEFFVKVIPVELTFQLGPAMRRPASRCASEAGRCGAAGSVADPAVGA
jgi:Domain of unknown function (DUF3471)